MNILVTFIPASHKEAVKSALFAAGAGQFEQYTHCAYEQLGTGQFRPTESATPFIGEKGRDEHVEEYRIEFFCEEDSIPDIVAALLKTHPYEQPAFYVIDPIHC
ncbi:MAG: NGG1p interacting factor NIF3 [Pseudomonadota bacterium]|nr:NGG1p interacting factor NIF3 [Pseudomonadota bacterium]